MMTGTTSTPPTAKPHAYHLNLPPQFRDEQGIPIVTDFAAKKARQTFDLAMSIKLKESFFEFNCNEEDADADSMDIDSSDLDESKIPYDSQEDDEEAPLLNVDDADSLKTVTKRCSRLLSMFSSLENLKFGGLSQYEIIDVTLHLMRLVTATISYRGDGTKRKASLHFDSVGAILLFGDDPDYVSQVTGQDDAGLSESKEDFESCMRRRFALPSPCRESLLLVLMNILSNKGPLRSVSNAAVFTDSNKNRCLMIIHWRPLLRMLLRTAPYLDEHSFGDIVTDSSSRMNTVLKRTVQLIRDSRHFFEQGVRPKNQQKTELVDISAREIWNMVQTDVLFRSNSNACFRGAILLYLFHPTCCSEEFYISMLPKWLEAWTNVDRCPEYDFLWLALLCRARKITVNYNWSPIRKRLLTLSQYWLQLPIGGGALDKSYPRAGNPRSRSCPAKLKAFVGSGSSYSEGIVFLTKVGKLLVTGLGTGESTVPSDSSKPGISEGTQDVLRFLSFVAPYFNPSNVGQWTYTLGAFLHIFSYELCCRIGAMAGQEILGKSYPEVAEAFGREQPMYGNSIPLHEIALIIDGILPLCQQALYSKSSHVGRAGEAAMLYLVQIDPDHTTPSFLDFATRALDISAVNLSHQAPVALSVLARLVQPGLRSNPAVLFSRLPQILSLTLAGIDSNDKNKTIRTLIFYRSLTSWVPVGSYAKDCEGVIDTSPKPSDGTMKLGADLYDSISAWRRSKQYAETIDRLPPNSPMHQVESMWSVNDVSGLIAEVGPVMSDWALEFLDRIFGLLRASGETEKASKRASGAASVDVMQAKNFARVLKETMMQFFVAMDDETFGVALRQLRRFIEEETLPSASKEASCLCQGAAAIRSKGRSPGLDALVACLTEDISHHSAKTVVYRIRCLAGAVRSAAECILQHQAAISGAIKFCLESEDKHIFKTGCKLLRHTLATCTEFSPLAFDAKPRIYNGTSGPLFGKSAQVDGDPIRWHVPTEELHEFATVLLKRHLIAELDAWSQGGLEGTLGFLNRSADLTRLRRCLRLMRYSIRGGSSLMLDFLSLDPNIEDFVPYEKACFNALSSSHRCTLENLRSRMCSFIIAVASVISADNLYPGELDRLDDQDGRKKNAVALSTDAKICKEVCNISMLLLTRRGTGFRAQEARSVWKAQKQLTSDFVLCSTADHVAEVLQCVSEFGDCRYMLYKDGENAGKTIPRRLLHSRVKIFHDFLQRSASFQIPRRLRRLGRPSDQKPYRDIFCGDTLPEFLESVEKSLSYNPLPIDSYEVLTDRLYALACHNNSQVRTSAASVVEYAASRFGWLMKTRTQRLLSALSLNDDKMSGKFGMPSCVQLSTFTDKVGKRKLSEALNGVCTLLVLPRHTKQVLQTEHSRCQFIETLFSAEKVIRFLPGEEVQKFVVFVQALFSPFRSKFYSLPRVAYHAAKKHNEMIMMALANLSEARTDSITTTETGSTVPHWRRKLLSCWVILSLLDEQDYTSYDVSTVTAIWSTCFRMIETERGQPLQRLALGLLGRLVQFPLATLPPVYREKFTSQEFCVSLGEALVYDHKEDTSVGSGHESQWAFGVEDYIREAARNIAPRTMFPFQRTSQAFGAFKSSHSHLVLTFLQLLDLDSARSSVRYLLDFALHCSAAPPSEDFRNQQAAAAEIFAAVCRYHLESMEKTPNDIPWTTLLLPHLEEVVNRIPFSLSGAYFDAIRYSLQLCSSRSFSPLTKWLGSGIEESLWQVKEYTESTQQESTAVSSSDGFTAQSKWLYLLSAVLIETSESGSSWYRDHLYNIKDSSGLEESTEAGNSISRDYVLETVVPRLFDAICHPFDSCRDHLSRVLFRICYECSRRQDLSMVTLLIERFNRLEDHKRFSPIHRLNGLNTIRRFISYSVHLGEQKFEFSECVVHILSTAFKAIGSKSTATENMTEDQVVALRAMEGEVANGYRSLLAEVSVTSAISYGGTSNIVTILDLLEKSSRDPSWQVRHAAAHFLRCFQSVHQFVFTKELNMRSLELIAGMLSDDRREVSAAAMSALTGVLAVSPTDDVAGLVDRYSKLAMKSKMRRQKKHSSIPKNEQSDESVRTKDVARAQNQQTAVFFLCAAVLAQPYETPTYVPVALAAISKHSFERNAPLGVREVVKKCCAEYKKTHMSDDWERHRKVFSTEELEALEDVISSPHYYA